MKKFKLGELLDATRGVSLSGSHYASTGQVKRLTLANFDYSNNGFKPDTSKDNIFYNGEVAEKFILEKGDIITPLTEQTPGLLGTTAMIPESGTYIQSQDVCLLKPFAGKLDAKFAYYLVSSKSVRDQLAARSQQTKIRHSSPDKIKDCSVFIPDVPAQERIGKLLFSIDDKIALNRKKIEKLEALAKTIYDYWFVQFDFPDANGRPYKSSGGKMVYNPILKREIPDGWEMKRLDDVVTDGGCPVNPIDVNGRPYTPIECFPIRKMSFYESKNSSEAKSSLVCYKAGDILLGAMRVYFHRVCVAPYEGITRTTSVIMRPKCDSVRAFAYETLNADVFIAYANAQSAASQQPFVVWNSIKDYKIVLPGNELVIDYSSVVQPMIDTVIALERENALLAKTREYLLPLLMNGQVEVGE